MRKFHKKKNETKWNDDNHDGDGGDEDKVKKNPFDLRIIIRKIMVDKYLRLGFMFVIWDT